MKHPNRDHGVVRLRRCLFLLLLVLPAGPAAAETLQDALSVAYGNNPQLLAERALLENTNEDVPQALSNWRPTVSVSVTGGKLREREDQNCAPEGNPQNPVFSPCPGQTTGSQAPIIQKLYQSSYSVTVTEPLYRGGRTVAATSEAYNLVDSERAHLTSVESTVFLTVTTDYLGVVEQAALLSLNQENEEILRKQVAATEDRYRFGELTHTDLYLAEAAYAEAVAGRKSAEGQLQVARAAYEHDVGQAPGDLATPSALPELPATRDEAASVALSAAPAVIQAQYAQQAAEDAVDVVRGQLLPTVVAQAQFQKTSDVTTYGLKVDNKSIIAQGSLPIFDGGLTYAQSRAAQKLVAQRKHQLDDARRQAVQAAQQAWDSLQAQRAALTDLRHSVDVNPRALDGLKEEARVGTRTVQDVLIQQQSLFQARVNLTTAVYNESVDEFTLVAAVGRLTARNLALPVELYDPERHLDAVRNKWFGFQTEP
jgi:outer membrane protein